MNAHCRTPGRGWHAACAAALVAALSGSVGCASSPEEALQYIDTDTAATITRCAKTFVFAHEAPNLGVNVRDYLNLGAFQVNRMGQHDFYLWASTWSTIPQRAESGPNLPVLMSTLTLRLDGEPLVLKRSTTKLRDTGTLKPVYPAPASSVVNAYYVVTQDMLHRIAGAAEIAVIIGEDRADRMRYALWSDARAELRDFLETSGSTAY